MKLLAIFCENCEIYTRNSWTAYEEKKKKKKILGVLNGSFLSSLVGEGNSLLSLFERGNLKKQFGKPWYKVLSNVTEHSVNFKIYEN